MAVVEARRLALGMTQRQLAERAGISRHCYQGLVTDVDRVLTLETMVGLADALEINFKELMSLSRAVAELGGGRWEPIVQGVRHG